MTPSKRSAVGPEHDGGEDAAGADAEAPGREIAVGMLVGADARHDDAVGAEAGVDELQAVAGRQVDVPLGIATADGLHVEAGGKEGVVDLLAHLEALERDARPDDGHEVGGARAVGVGHGQDGLAGYAAHRAAPSGMDGADGLVAGISGRKGFTMITLTKENLHKQVGFGYGLLKILDRHDISFESMPCGIDNLTVVLNDADIKGKMDQLYHEIRTELKPDTVEIASSIALIATVGHGMARTLGVAARLFTALSEAGVSSRIIDQSPKEMNLIVGVDQRDFETAVRAIYRAFCQ